jgi:hypothetical protein
LTVTDVRQATGEPFRKVTDELTTPSRCTFQDGPGESNPLRYSTIYEFVNDRYTMQQMRQMLRSSGTISDRSDLGPGAFQVSDDEGGIVIFDVVFTRHGRTEELSFNNTPATRTHITLNRIKQWATKLARRIEA